VVVIVIITDTILATQDMEPMMIPIQAVKGDE